MRRYILAIFVIILLALMSIIIFVPRGKNSEPNKSSKSIGAARLPDYANTTAQITMNIDGPIVAKENHLILRVAIGRDTRSVRLLRGYPGNTLRKHEYSNNQDAFAAFLYALETAGFTHERIAPSSPTEQGACPLGERITFEITQGGAQKLHLWTTSCSKTTGTFNGDPSLTQQLFQLQIPDYLEVNSGSGL